MIMKKKMYYVINVMKIDCYNKLIEIVKLKRIFHKYCSGSIDEGGKCFITSDRYGELTEELIEWKKNVNR